MELVSEENIDELIRAQTQIWSHALYFIKSMSLKCAVQLGIPDIIFNHGRPMTLSDLVDSLSVHPTKSHHVYRLMRVLVHSGFFSLQKSAENSSQEGYILTPASRLLLKNSPLDSTPLVSIVLDPVLMQPFDYLSVWFRNDDPTPFFTANGETIWGYAARESRINCLFNESMATDSSLVSKIMIIKCKEVFKGIDTLVDAGGGTGIMAKAIAQTFPHINCTVLDLPHVVANLKGTENLNFLGGDMFQAVPPADAILLKWILHDWPDEDCVKILKNCKEAIERKRGKEGKIIIIDAVMGNQTWDSDDDWTEAQLLFDMEMMASISGSERNEKEWAKIFFDAGFTNYKISPTFGPRALIELYL